MTARHACVIGWPVGHSRSPLIHGYWLKHYGIAGTYDKREVAPEQLEQFLADLPAAGLVGCNVTLPHKEATFRLVRVADELTLRLGVVNTVYLDNGLVSGLSTDGEGFVANLQATAPHFSIADSHVTLLGAGGAARAIAGALLAAGAAEIAVVNRAIERCELLRRDFGARIIPLHWSRRTDVIAGTGLLVNTTSLGMKGQPDLDIDLRRLPPEALVSDIVYVPLETSLLRNARQRGNLVIPGLGMLLHQAVRGFELWFGRRPEVTATLHDLVAADIERTA
jgi:shikimate dehydrogenase